VQELLPGKEWSSGVQEENVTVVHIRDNLGMNWGLDGSEKIIQMKEVKSTGYDD
jgi:hypothetical protein